MNLVEVINGILFVLRAGYGAGAISLSSWASLMPSSGAPPAPRCWIPLRRYPRTGKAADSLAGDGGRSGEFSFVPSLGVNRSAPPLP